METRIGYRLSVISYQTRFAVISFLASAFFGLLYFTSAFAATNTFTVTLPANTEVTMQNPNSLLPFTVTNTGNGNSITDLTFKGNVAKYLISSATVPPPGWCVNDVAEDEIKFALIQPNGNCSNASTASAIAPGASLVFNILINPVAAATDVAGDSLNEVKSSGMSFSGALPTWTRRSLEMTMIASPGSAGVGSEITLVMQITNRSTATQTLIASSPEPPASSNGQVTKTAGPFYGATLLNGALTASASSLTVDSTAELSATGGVLQIDSEEIYYSGFTGLALNGVIRAYSGTTGAAHSDNSSVYSLTQYSLAAGATRTIIWKYTVGATATGSVYFTARATNGAGTAKSMSVNSNTVVIGNFTASILIDPTSVVTGQSVTVRMTVRNNGASAIVNVLPSALTACAGGAVETLSAGPAPAGISSIAPGGAGVFTWQYVITGSNGQTYCLTGSAAANGPLTSNTAASNNGTIALYSASVSPPVIVSGAAPKTFTWTIYNGGACALNRVDIEIPAQGGATWNYQSASAAGWTISQKTGPDRIRFTDPNDNVLFPAGGTRTFSITFSTTESVTSDKDVSFPITLRDTQAGGACDGEKSYTGTSVTVTANAITLAHSPAGPIYADGSSFYTMTATLASGGSPISGKTLTFTSTNGSLSAPSVVTDSNGQATVKLFAPELSTNTSAVVTASYMNADGTDTVNFNGWTKADLQYWGGLSPASVDCGTAYTFSMDVKNRSASTSITLNTGSYFAFNDSASVGSSVYRLYLDSNASNLAAISAGATRTLTFGSLTSSGAGGGVAGPAAFIIGTYLPTVNSTAPESGLFFSDGGTNDQWRGVTDSITVTGACGGAGVNVNIIEWQELR